MSDTPIILPDDPAALKAMIAHLQAGNARMDADIGSISATLRAHEALVQALQIQIARLKKQKFGARSERPLREIEQLELALEHPEIAGAAAISRVAPDDDAELSVTNKPPPPTRRVAANLWSRQARRASASCWTPVMTVRNAAAPCA